jgi:hypothetical protein
MSDGLHERVLSPKSYEIRRTYRHPLPTTTELHRGQKSNEQTMIKIDTSTLNMTHA